MVLKLNIQILTLAVFCLGACTESIDNNKEQQAIDTSTTVDSFEKTSVDFSGTWVNRKYIEKLKETRSPREAQGAADISAILLPDQTEEQAMIIWGFHEGLEALFRKEGSQYGLATGKPENLDYKLSLSDGVLTMADESFTRIADSKDFHIVERLLFEGSYNWDDKTVEFTGDGKIKGSDSLTFYSVNVDYMDAGMQVDQISLGKTEKDANTYGFKFREDTLTIHEINCIDYDDDYCVEVENGKEVLRMVKFK